MSRAGRLRNVALLGGGTLVAAVFGLLFQSLLAYHFGAGAETDAWFMSLSIYAFLGKFLMLTHLKSLALPVYRRMAARDPGEARRFGRLLVGWSAAVLVAAAAVLALGAPLLVDGLAPGYDGALRDLTVSLVRIRMPALVFLGTTTAGLVVLESGHRFGVTVSAQKIVPAALMLLLFLVVADRGGMVGVGWIGLAGGVAGGVVALLAVRPLLWDGRESGLPTDSVANAPTEAGRRTTSDAATPPDARAALRGVGGQWLRFSGSNAATFVGEWAFRVAASLLPVGLFSAVLYGRMVHDLLHGAVNDAAQTVSLPRFAQAGEPREGHAEEGRDAPLARIGVQLRESLGALATVNVPIAAFVAATAPWTVAVLFGRGRFLEDGMLGPSAVALQIFAAGFLLQGLNQLLFAAAFAAERGHLVNRVQIVGHLVRAALLVPAVLAFSYVGLVATQVAMNLLVLLVLVMVAPRSWHLGARAALAPFHRHGASVVGGTALAAALWFVASPWLPDPSDVSTARRLVVVAAAAAGWGGIYVTVTGALGVPAVRQGMARLARLGVGAVAVAAGLGVSAASGSAQETRATDADRLPSAAVAPAGQATDGSSGPALLPADHWAVAVLEALEARGAVPAGSARAGPLHAARADRLLAAAEDPVARAALERLRGEAAPGATGVVGRVGGGWWFARDGTPGASGPGTSGTVRFGGPGARVFGSFSATAVRDGGGAVHLGSLGVRLGPLALQAGRARVRLGGGASGALTLSDAAPLDGVLLTTLRPPDGGPLGPLTVTAGLFRMSAYAAPVDDPWFALLRVAAAPTPWLSAAVSRAALIGGRFAGGTPRFQPGIVHPPDDGDLGAGDVLDILVGRVTGLDNQVWAADVRASLAGLGVPATVWGEIGLEDNERSFGDGAVQVGALLDVPVPAGLLALRWEYTGIGDAGRWCRWCDTLPAFWYQHTRFQDGWRTADDLLGHPLGGYGRQHLVGIVAADPGAGLRAAAALRRINRQEFNLQEATRPGGAWGVSGDVRVRGGPGVEALLTGDLEWGDDGWAAGRVHLGVDLLLPPAR